MEVSQVEQRVVKQEVEQAEKKGLSNTVRNLTTFAIFTECITFGCAFTVYSPVLVELERKYDTDIETISKIFVVFMFVYPVGAAAAGLMYNKVIKRQTGAFFALMGICVSLFLSPLCPTLTYLLITMALYGLSSAAYDTAQIVWIMEMWQSRSGPFVQAQHMFVALGNNIPPILMAFFIKEHNHDEGEEIESYFNTQLSSTIPFFILGTMAAVNVSFELFLISCFPYTPPIKEETAEVKKQDEKETSVNWKKIKLIALSAIFVGFYIGMEMCSLQFIPTIGLVGAGMTESEAALVLSGLTGAFAAGRVVGIVISIKVSGNVILWTNIFLLFCANVLLLFWGHASPNMLWASSIILGFGLSTVFASFCAFMERHMVFTDMVGSILLVTGSSVSIVYPAFVGKWVEVEHRVLAYSNFFSCGMMLVSFILINLLVKGNK